MSKPPEFDIEWPEIQKELWDALQAKCENRPGVAIHSYDVEHLRDRGCFAVWYGSKETFRLTNGIIITITSHGAGEDTLSLSQRIDKAAKKARKRVKLMRPKKKSGGRSAR